MLVWSESTERSLSYCMTTSQLSEFSRLGVSWPLPPRDLLQVLGIFVGCQRLESVGRELMDGEMMPSLQNLLQQCSGGESRITAFGRSMNLESGAEYLVSGALCDRYRHSTVACHAGNGKWRHAIICCMQPDGKRRHVLHRIIDFI